MRNAPSTLIAMPHTHNLAELESAFNARRRAIRTEVQAASLAGRILSMFRAAVRLPHAPAPVLPPVHEIAQPSMSWVDGPRVQPRGPNGRFLPRTWLADAELFLPADRAWFRSPIAEGK